MKLTRLKAAFKSVLNMSTNKLKEKRINTLLDNAQLNAEEKKNQAEISMEEVLSKINSDESADNIINDLNNLLSTIEEAELEVERVDKIRNFLKEEVEIEK